MIRVHAVIFDRDGTLVFFDEAAIEHLMQRIATVAPQVHPTILNRHWETWGGPWPRTPEAEPQFWRQFWQPLAHRYHLDQPQIADLCAICAAYPTCFRRFPDTLPCLSALHAAHIKLAVLTNFELATVATTLTACGIDAGLFHGLFSSGTIGFHKPDPRAFLTVTATLQLPPDACAYIDDQIEHVHAARALGLHAIWLDRTRATSDLDAGIAHALTPLIPLFVPTFVRNTVP